MIGIIAPHVVVRVGTRRVVNGILAGRVAVMGAYSITPLRIIQKRKRPKTRRPRMLTLPADLTPAQKRAINEAIFLSLNPGFTIATIGDEPPDRAGLDKQGHGYYEIPDYFTGDACWRLVGEILTKGGRLMICRCREDGAIDSNGELYLADYRLSHPNYDGTGPTPQAAVVACVMDWKGIAIPEVTT